MSVDIALVPCVTDSSGVAGASASQTTPARRCRAGLAFQGPELAQDIGPVMTGHPGHGGTQLGAPRPGGPGAPGNGRGHTRSLVPRERRGQARSSPARDSPGIPGTPGLSGRLSTEQQRWGRHLGLPSGKTPEAMHPLHAGGHDVGRARLQTAAGAPLPAPPHTLCPSVPSCLLLPRTLTQRMLKDPTPSSRRASHLMVGEGTAV